MEYMYLVRDWMGTDKRYRDSLKMPRGPVP